MRRLLVALGITLAACGSSGGGTDTVATPAFSPAAGTYTTAQSVTLTTTAPGASIFYTTDGSTPTSASTRYSGNPIPVPASATVKAIATASGKADSAVATAEYVIDAAATPAAAPTFLPAAGSYTSAQSVTLSSTTAGAVIHYTVDGAAPTTASTRYTGPVAVSSSLTLKAIATAPGHTASEVASATYAIGGGGNATYLTVCNHMASRLEALFVSCYHANPVYVSQVFSSDCALVQKEIDHGLATWDAAQGAACDAALQTLTCDVLTGGAALPAACATALSGTVQPNGTCYSGLDCRSGYCTFDVSGTCPGTCQPFVAQGGVCTDTSACAPGLTCSSGHCATLSGAGGACPCQSDLWCDASAGGAGQCRARLGQGAACNVVSGACQAGLVCVGSGASGTCRAYVGAGEPCTPPARAYDMTECGLGYACDPSTSRCVSYPTVGESCATIPYCLDGYCDWQTSPSAPICKALVADGGACTFDLQCASQSCTAGACDPSTSDFCSMP